jgi:hypothetical protein
MSASTVRHAVRGTVAMLSVVGALLLGAGAAQAGLTPSRLQAVTDQYLYSTSLADFQTIRAAAPHADQLDWTSDGCSVSPDKPLGYNFLPACYRHDFGYGNYKKQNRFTEPNRKRIDDNFKADMYTICHGRAGCKVVANIYYGAVRAFGGEYAGGIQPTPAPVALC